MSYSMILPRSNSPEDLIKQAHRYYFGKLGKESIVVEKFRLEGNSDTKNLIALEPTVDIFLGKDQIEFTPRIFRQEGTNTINPKESIFTLKNLTPDLPSPLPNSFTYVGDNEMSNQNACSWVLTRGDVEDLAKEGTYFEIVAGENNPFSHKLSNSSRHLGQMLMNRIAASMKTPEQTQLFQKMMLPSGN